MRASRFDLGDLGALWNLVGRHHSPQRARRIACRAFVGGVEAVAIGGQNRTVLVGIATGELQLRLQQFLHLPLLAVPAYPPQPAGTPITDQVVSIGVDAQTDYGAAGAFLHVGPAGIGRVVWIVGYRQNADLRTFLIFRDDRETMPAGVQLPAVVLATLAVMRLPEHILPVILSDIRDEQIACLFVEVDLPRIAHAIGPDFRARNHANLGELQFTDPKQRHQPRGCSRSEGIILRYEVTDRIVRRIDVDAQNLAHRGVEPLAGVEWIALPTAVALSDIQITVRPKLHPAAVVIVIGLRHVHDRFGGFVDLVGGYDVRGFGIDRHAHDHRCAIERQRRIVQVDVAVLLELWMEGDRPESLLDETGLHVIPKRIDRGQVDKRRIQDLAVFPNNLDLADTLDDEQSACPHRTLTQRLR